MRSKLNRMQQFIMVMALLSCFILPVSQLTIQPVYGVDDQQEVANEYEVKAVFLYTFIKYINWEETVNTETFVITVLGHSDILKPLRIISGSKDVDGKEIIVNEFLSIEEIEGTDILFVSRDFEGDLDQVVEFASKHKFLTVGESRSSSGKGLVINFIIIDGKIRFEIDMQAMRLSGTSISSNLLKLAVIVENG